MAEVLYNFNNGSATLIAGANITLSTGSGAITIIGGVNSGATTFLAGVSNVGNTSGATTAINNQLVLAGGNNITLSQSTNGQSATVTVSAPNYSQSFGASNLGNTAGTSGIASGSNVRFVFQGGNNVTLSQSVNGASGTITIQGQTGTIANIGTAVNAVASVGSTGTITRYAPEDHQHAGVFSIGVSTGGNTLGSTGVLPGQMVLVGGTNITLSQSTNATNGMTVTVVGPAQSTLEMWIPIDYAGNTSARQIGQSSVKVFPAILEQAGSFSQVDLYASIALTTNPLTSVSGTISLNVGLYTRNVSTLSLASSGSNSYTWQNTGNASMSLLTGLRHLSVPVAFSMPAGNYWVGMMSRTASAGANAMSLSNYGAVVSPAWVNDFPAAPNASHQFMPGLGVYSAQTAALPTTIAFSEIVGSDAQTIVPAIDFLNFNFT